MGTPVAFIPIGVIRSEHKLSADTPVQPIFAKGCPGRVELFAQYELGLQDIEGFSHVILIYQFDRVEPGPLVVQPFLDDIPHGVFATRYPSRPNPIGLSVVQLVGREGATLLVEDIDILDGTPLLDVKPFVPCFDAPDHATGGWTDNVDDATRRQRGRRGYRGQDARKIEP